MNDKTLLITHAISKIKSIPHPTAGARLQVFNAGIGALMTTNNFRTVLVRVHSRRIGMGNKTFAAAGFVHVAADDGYALLGFKGAL